MTRQRRRVLAELTEAQEKGERISLRRLARQCGLYDFRDARRIVRDLRKFQRAN